jgi:hypothetical protein
MLQLASTGIVEFIFKLEIFGQSNLYFVKSRDPDPISRIDLKH